MQGRVEAGDACEGSLIWEDGGQGDFLYQRIWSNAAVDAGGDPCIPALSVPYYNVTLSQDWYPMDGGIALEIPLTGWSTAPMGDWLVYATTIDVSTGFQGLTGQSLTVRTLLGLESPGGCKSAVFGINNGVAGTLEVPALSSLQPGDFAVIEVESFLADGNCHALPGQDEYHSNLVGVFVPLDSSQASACGLYNFETECPMVQGYCPSNSSCAANNSCKCDPGYVDLNCSGEPCKLVGCQFPQWWCAPLVAGSCGAQNFTVTCSDGKGGTYSCPAQSSCGSDEKCSCDPGLTAMDCAGQTCNGDCLYPNWWCTQ